MGGWASLPFPYSPEAFSPSGSLHTPPSLLIPPPPPLIPQGPHQWYSPSSADIINCDSDLCRAAQTGHIQGCTKSGDGTSPPSLSLRQQCDYDLYYADGSSSQGVLVRDRLLFLHPSGALRSTLLTLG